MTCVSIWGLVELARDSFKLVVRSRDDYDVVSLSLVVL
jgi:hypothetical protein